MEKESSDMTYVKLNVSSMNTKSQLQRIFSVIHEVENFDIIPASNEQSIVIFPEFPFILCQLLIQLHYSLFSLELEEWILLTIGLHSLVQLWWHKKKMLIHKACFQIYLEEPPPKY